MSEDIELGRKYTWGAGIYEYKRTGFDEVYCLTTLTHLPKDLVSIHLLNVPKCPSFRYLDKPYSTNAADDIRQPSHYQVFPDVESIEIIARSMTQAEFKGFCMGNVLKYRLRAGKKSELATMEKDLKKADFYKELFEQHKGKCYA